MAGTPFEIAAREAIEEEKQRRQSRPDLAKVIVGRRRRDGSQHPQPCNSVSLCTLLEGAESLLLGPCSITTVKTLAVINKLKGPPSRHTR